MKSIQDGMVEIAHLVVDDAGTVINPLLLEGQLLAVWHKALARQ